ncbi:TadE/TadG family type IV pilus assembly protein [Endozoicomonadaceae bacterium StTr2]
MNLSSQLTFQKGSIVVETTLGMLSFLTLIFFWIEFSWLGFVSAAVDFAAAEASRSTRLTTAVQVGKALQSSLQQQSSPWAGLIDTKKLKVENCNDKRIPVNLAVTICQITYPYQPVAIYGKPVKSKLISRDALFIRQE